MTRARDISNVITDANLGGTLDVSGAFTSNGIDDNADANAITIDSSENVGIGETTPLGKLHIRSSDASITSVNANSDELVLENNGTCGISIASATNSTGNISFIDSGDTNQGRIQYDHSSDNMIFRVNDAERMRIDSSGNLLVGKTASNSDNAGFEANATGFTSATRNDGIVFVMDRLTSSGTILEFRKDNTGVGNIQERFGSIQVGSGQTNLIFNNSADEIAPSALSGGVNDDVVDLGANNRRFDNIHATNGTIQTSDRNEKQDIEELTDAEKRVATVAKGLMRKFRWKSKVAEKGDKARTHFGIIAQDLEDAFKAEGLDASKYAMFCSDTWWEKEEKYTDDDGTEQTRLMDYKKEEEAPKDAIKKTRLGVRYSELLAFIISAI